MKLSVLLNEHKKDKLFTRKAMCKRTQPLPTTRSNTQQLSTTHNNMQQGVQMDATCNIQQSCICLHGAVFGGKES